MEVDDSDITESIQNDKIIVDDSEQMQSEFQEEENVDSKDIDDEYIDETSTIGDEVGENPQTVILENRDEKDYLEFIEKLFPKKRQNWILDDLDLISPEESYTRLTWLGIILTNILCIVTFVLSYLPWGLLMEFVLYPLSLLYIYTIRSSMFSLCYI